MTPPDADRVVEVRTGARLHFGLFATGRSPGRLGGIGMMIDRPGYLLRAQLADEDMIDADSGTAKRVRTFFDGLRLNLEEIRPGLGNQSYRIEIPRTIPSHRGLGSGTQLAYAIVQGVATLLQFRLSAVPTDELGRGERSWVGTIGFKSGGFIADPGRFGRWKGDETLRQKHQVDDRFVAIRQVTQEWRVLVVVPRSVEGPSGDPETEAFRRLGPMPEETTSRLGELIATQILPGLDGRSFHHFASGVAEFNRLVGEHFAPAQGGVYAHPLIRELSTTLAGTDWPYLAQSSWGPAAAVLCESDESANVLRAFLDKCLDREQADVFIAAPKNDGASVTVV